MQQQEKGEVDFSAPLEALQSEQQQQQQQQRGQHGRRQQQPQPDRLPDEEVLAICCTRAPHVTTQLILSFMLPSVCLSP